MIQKRQKLELQQLQSYLHSLINKIFSLLSIRNMAHQSQHINPFSLQLFNGLIYITLQTNQDQKPTQLTLKKNHLYKIQSLQND